MVRVVKVVQEMGIHPGFPHAFKVERRSEAVLEIEIQSPVFPEQPPSHSLSRTRIIKISMDKMS